MSRTLLSLSHEGRGDRGPRVARKWLKLGLVERNGRPLGWLSSAGCRRSRQFKLSVFALTIAHIAFARVVDRIKVPPVTRGVAAQGTGGFALPGGVPDAVVTAWSVVCRGGCTSFTQCLGWRRRHSGLRECRPCPLTALSLSCSRALWFAPAGAGGFRLPASVCEVGLLLPVPSWSDARGAESLRLRGAAGERGFVYLLLYSDFLAKLGDQPIVQHRPGGEQDRRLPPVRAREQLFMRKVPALDVARPYAHGLFAPLTDEQVLLVECAQVLNPLRPVGVEDDDFSSRLPVHGFVHFQPPIITELG